MEDVPWYEQERAPDQTDPFWIVQRLSTDALPRAKHAPKAVEDNFRAVSSMLPSDRPDNNRVPEPLIRFLKTYDDCVMKIAWPPKFYLRVKWAEESLVRDAPDPLARFSDDLDVYWLKQLGKITTIFAENDLGNAKVLDLHVFVGSDMSVFAYNSQKTCLYTLCDHLSDLLDTGARYARLFYTTDYNLGTRELESGVYGHPVLSEGVFDKLLAVNPQKSMAKQFAKSCAGHMLTNFFNDHIFVLGNEHTLGLHKIMSVECFDVLHHAGFFVFGITSAVNVQIVLMHENMSGVFHWTFYHAVMLVAEDVRSYLRMKCPQVLGCGMRTYYGGSQRIMRMGKTFGLKMTDACQLPDMRFFAERWGRRGGTKQSVKREPECKMEH
ncbi:B28.1 [miniopterid betaherpesvirus 1]|uniref:B28.1 n=1 Tax=miniopterid betaherpesvirus 1 TaxID=3070189 RepID=I3VPZ7_9BETA|nr:B28.1 [miniopterid betaherpesvirus 1]AFK83841.1 B28.1 [miniopterid betaherpesvirus 1]